MAEADKADFIIVQSSLKNINMVLILSEIRAPSNSSNLEVLLKTNSSDHSPIFHIISLNIIWIGWGRDVEE